MQRMQCLAHLDPQHRSGCSSYSEEPVLKFCNKEHACTAVGNGLDLAELRKKAGDEAQRALGEQGSAGSAIGKTSNRAQSVLELC